MRDMLDSWIQKTEVICREQVEPFLALQGQVLEPCDYYHTLIQLALASDESSRSALVLLRCRHVWDCEPLMRSVAEGTLKFLNLCDGSEDDRVRRFKEFAVILPKVNSLKRHERLVRQLACAENDLSLLRRPLQELLLANEEVASITAEYPRDVRRRLEHSWSFYEIVARLAKQPAYDGLPHLLYSYGMSSNTLHADADGIGMRWERLMRHSERREYVNIAHAGRIISDILSYLGFRLHGLLQVTDRSTTNFHRYTDSISPILDEISAAQRKWEKLEYEVT
jgi:hypothetical protein